VDEHNATQGNNRGPATAVCLRPVLCVLSLALATPTFATPAPAALDVPASSGKLTAIGEAFDRATGQLLYREYHFRQPGSALGSVEYRGPDRRLLGTKSLDFQVAPWAPAFQQIDLRTGEMLFARWQGSSLTLGYRENHQGEIRQEQVPERALVADAGFDNFIRAHWSGLLGEGKKSFSFAVPSRLDTLTLVAQRRACKKPSKAAETVCFRVQPDNWLFAVLVDPIDLQYDANSRQLLEFQGLSNITDDNGEPQVVTIRYQHAEPGSYLADDRATQASPGRVSS
jgi:hypothetical protein